MFDTDKGIYFATDKGKWCVHIRKGTLRKSCYRDTKQEAIKVRDKMYADAGIDVFSVGKIKFYEFRYTMFIDDLMIAKREEIIRENKKRLHWNKNNPDQKPQKTIPLYEAKMKLEATQEIHNAIKMMKRGNNKQRVKARLLELEIELIRKREKMETVKAINVRYGDNAHTGNFTLEEIGKTLGFTKERARQIEYQANRRMNHPEMKRILKDAIYA